MTRGKNRKFKLPSFHTVIGNKNKRISLYNLTLDNEHFASRLSHFTNKKVIAAQFFISISKQLDEKFF